MAQKSNNILLSSPVEKSLTIPSVNLLSLTFLRMAIISGKRQPRMSYGNKWEIYGGGGGLDCAGDTSGSLPVSCIEGPGYQKPFLTPW